MTHSTVAIAMVWVFYVLPIIFLGPFSGTIVDFGEKRRILIITNLIESIIILLYLLAKTKIWPIYSVIFLYALVDQFYLPAEGAVLPSLVSRGQLAMANSLFLFSFYATRLIGFSIAGPLVKLGGENAPFIIGFIFLAVAALSTASLPKLGFQKRTKLEGVQEFFDKIREGYTFVRETPGVLFPLLMMGTTQIAMNILLLLSPSYATEILKLNLLDTGLVLIFPSGIGAIVALQLVVRLGEKMRKKKVIAYGLYSAAVSLLFLGVVVPLLRRGGVIAAIAIAFILGFSYVAMLIPSQTLIQEKTPDRLRGRVFGVLNIILTLANFLPILSTAALADAVGSRYIILLLGIGLAVVAIYTHRKEPYETPLATNHRS